MGELCCGFWPLQAKLCRKASELLQHQGWNAAVPCGGRQPRKCSQCLVTGALPEPFRRSSGMCLCSMGLQTLGLSVVSVSDWALHPSDASAALPRLWRCAAQTCASLVCPGSFIDFAIILRLSAFPVSPSESPQELREPGAAFPYLLLAMRVSSQGFQLSAPSILSQGWVSLMPGYGQTSDPGLH